MADKVAQDRWPAEDWRGAKRPKALAAGGNTDARSHCNEHGLNEKGEAPMRFVSKRGVSWGLWAMALVVLSILGLPQPAAAVEVGEPAPDFKLPSTNGVDIGLGDFKGKRWVFLEFYAQDFVPT